MKSMKQRWDLKTLGAAALMSTVMTGGALAATNIAELQTYFGSNPVTINGTVTDVDRAANELIVADETGLITIESPDAHAYTTGQKIVASGYIEDGVFGKRRYFDAEKIELDEKVVYNPAYDRKLYNRY